MNEQRPKWGRPILPKETDQLIGDIQDKHYKARDLLGQIKAHPKLQGREDVQRTVTDLQGKHDQAGVLLNKIRYSAEYRYELKRMSLTPDKVKSLIPARETPWGQPPLFVVGLVDTEGKQHMFQRPIRTAR